ncbi:hypothetical protein OZD61_03370, partial [Wolbachia endosymbiont of Drosophila bocki]|nr:hypothetical protein [Wolbachia endosymbiont of Drosophila bocki]
RYTSFLTMLILPHIFEILNRFLGIRFQILEKLLHYSILLVKRTDCFNKKGNSLISGCYPFHISFQYS